MARSGRGLNLFNVMFIMNRKVHTIDATDKILGRLATEVAVLLRGKHKALFDPATDCGDAVEIENVDKMHVTGNKMEDKLYRHHTGYKGHLKEETLAHLWERKGPREVLKRAVWNMLPKNRTRKHVIQRLLFKK